MQKDNEFLKIFCPSIVDLTDNLTCKNIQDNILVDVKWIILTCYSQVTWVKNSGMYGNFKYHFDKEKFYSSIYLRSTL